MALHVRKNQYRGINAHLHSVLQHETAGWEGFHTKHIADLTAELSAQLPDGYVVDLLSAVESIDYDPRSYLSAIVIRRAEGDNNTTPITWIEVLSPTNKIEGAGAAQYDEKRIKVLQSRLVLVEIDYLHETMSPISKLPSYPDREANAYPYSIAVTDPRPTLQAGTLRVYGFRVDDPIPNIPIPLALKDEPITLNLGKVYQQSFEGVSAFSYRVDYEQLPPAFATYDEIDQQRIRARMQMVIQAHNELTTQSGDSS